MKRMKYQYQIRILSRDDVVLVIDDFLANGQAALGLIDIVEASRRNTCRDRNCD